MEPSWIEYVHSSKDRNKGYWNVSHNNKVIGSIFMTHHPTLLYEACTVKGTQAKRVKTLEEGAKYLQEINQCNIS
jgi:hypothetical protein